MYQDTFQDKAHAKIEEAGRPVPHDEVVAEVLGLSNARGPVARKLANRLLRSDTRFAYEARRGWGLAGPASPEDELKSLTFTVVDTETTGTDRTARITELGAVRVKGRRPVAEFQSLINCEAEVPAFIEEMTGITNEMLKDAPPPEQVIPQFHRFLGQTVVVAHNLSFDARFLSYEFRNQGFEPPEAPALCTLKMARKLLRLRGNDLGQVAGHFGIDIRGRHRALGDARATASILIKFVKLLEGQGLKTLGEALTLMKPGKS